MASISDHLVQNERVKMQALIEACRYMDHDTELINALAGIGNYLKRVVYNTNEAIREGSTLERVIMSRMNRMD